VKLLMQVDVILLKLLDPLPQKVPLVPGFIPLLNQLSNHAVCIIVGLSQRMHPLQSTIISL
jgi:hypothetical protein